MKSAPEQMVYGLESSPPLGILIVLALQHVFIAIADLAMPVLLIRSIGGSSAQTTGMVQISMVAFSLGTLLQIQKKGIGSGYLIPHSATSIFLAPSLLAIQSGGIALVAGMTVLAGSIQVALAKVAQRLGTLFPVHLSGLILTINGCILVHGAVARTLGNAGSSALIDWRMAAVGMTTLTTTAVLFFKGRGMLRICGLGFGLISGCLVAAALDVDNNQLGAAICSTPLFALPHLQHPGFDIDIHLLCPYLVAALAVGMKGSGLIAKGHQINCVTALNECRRRLGAGLLADGVGTLLSGLLGGCGTSMSAANVSLSIASKVTSRRVGYGVAAIFLLLVFFPKLAAVLSSMPLPVIGAATICIGINLIVMGIQLIQMARFDWGSVLVLGLPLMAGLWMEFAPFCLEDSSSWVAALMSSFISVTALMAFGLHWAIYGLGAAGAIAVRLYSKAKSMFFLKYRRCDRSSSGPVALPADGPRQRTLEAALCVSLNSSNHLSQSIPHNLSVTETIDNGMPRRIYGLILPSKYDKKQRNLPKGWFACLRETSLALFNIGGCRCHPIGSRQAYAGARPLDPNAAETNRRSTANDM